MDCTIEIENIEAMRRHAGIDDVELREAVRGLRVGDFVKLTLLTGTTGVTGETLVVRITRIRGRAFRGKLADKPTTTSLSKLRAGSPVTFSADQIHSIPERRPTNGR